jgi:hypothetical protein
MSASETRKTIYAMHKGDAMRKCRTILIVVLVWAVATGATGVFAGERADWGRVVAVGTMSDGAVLLIENDQGIQAIVVDPSGEVCMSTGKQTNFATIKPNDRIDFAVSTWAGIQIVDLVHVTPVLEGTLASAQ